MSKAKVARKPESDMARTLAAAEKLVAMGEPITIRKLMEMTGSKNDKAVSCRIRNLRALGQWPWAVVRRNAVKSPELRRPASRQGKSRCKTRRSSGLGDEIVPEALHILEVARSLASARGIVTVKEVVKVCGWVAGGYILDLRDRGLWPWRGGPKLDGLGPEDAAEIEVRKAEIQAENRAPMIDGRDEQDLTPPGVPVRHGQAKAFLEARKDWAGEQASGASPGKRIERGAARRVDYRLNY